MEENIKFGLIQTNSDTNEMITSILLNYGIPSVKIDPRAENIDAGILKEIKFLFIDFDYADNSSFNYIKKVSEIITPFPFLLIGSSFNVTQDLISRLNSYNLISFMAKPVTHDILKVKIRQIIDKYADHFSARKHIRIKPDGDDAMRVNFKFSSNFYSCKVLDISLGGVAAEVYSNNDNLPFRKSDLLNDITINLGIKEGVFDAEIVTVKSKFISLKFNEYKGSTYEILSKYILKKISI